MWYSMEYSLSPNARWGISTATALFFSKHYPTMCQANCMVLRVGPVYRALRKLITRTPMENVDPLGPPGTSI